jgi:heat shock protein HslJ
MKKAIYALIVCVVFIIGFFALASYMSKEKPVNVIEEPVLEESYVEEGTEVGTSTEAKLPAGSVPVTDPASIKEITWVWERTIMVDEKEIVPVKAGTYSVFFSTDGRVTGQTSCNGFGGDYEIGLGGFISFGPFMSTLMYCEGSQEAEFSQAVTNSDRYALNSEGKLVLTMKDGGLVVLSK